MQYIFWIAFGIIFYNYIGYGLLLFVINSLKGILSLKRDTPADDVLPDVTVVIAAYNEEAVILEKINNCFQLDYPEEKLFFVFVTDGSTDQTAQIIRGFPRIVLLNDFERRGKTEALNRAMNIVKTQVTIFSDANTVLNRDAVKNIVKHYKDSCTGGVAGEKRILVNDDSQTQATGEGFYWQYESFLKRLDSLFYTVVGAAGELFSIRTSLWEPLPKDVILDDFVISARINLRGYRIGYAPDAWASELPSSSLEDEKKRKIRISAGAFQAMALLTELLNVFKHPTLFFQFFSHRILRWTLTPLSFPFLFVANALLLCRSDNSLFYYYTFLLQVIFYVLAFIGSRLTDYAKYPQVLKIFYYILFMNYSVYLGFFRFVKGRQSVIWEKSERKLRVRSDIINAE